MSKIEIAKELRSAFKLCKECPLNDICTFLVDSNSSKFDAICDELDSMIEDEKGNKDNE
jgi:hypothetical protein